MTRPGDVLSEIIDNLEELRDKFRTRKPPSARALKGIRENLNKAAERVSVLSVGLDPILHPNFVFNPTDPVTAGRIAAMALVAQDRHPMDAIPNFYGSGIYALYYNGPHPAYAPLSGSEHPIYVGKAEPQSPNAPTPQTQGTALTTRLREHAKSIRAASTGPEASLSLQDFSCRFLVVQSGFQPAAENQLIRIFRPVWNSEMRICHGIGKHGDNQATRDNKRSPWDTIHPGRKWAKRATENQMELPVIEAALHDHCRDNHIFRSVDEITATFLSTMRQVEVPGAAQAAGAPQDAAPQNEPPQDAAQDAPPPDPAD